jgi:hypothetical protein
VVTGPLEEFAPQLPLTPESVDVSVLEAPEESLEVQLGEEPAPAPVVAFDANLADHIPQDKIGSIASDLVQQVDLDKGSRSEWEEAYRKGLDLLGIKVEERTVPWPKAFGAYHPVLTEAVVRFQSNAIMEIFPASGPVKTQIIGKVDQERLAQAQRVQEDMSYWLTERMPEYRPETEQLLFGLALAGSAFRKVCWDNDQGRPSATYVPAEDLIIPYGATSVRNAPRITHVIRRSKNEIRKAQVAGFYRDVDIPETIPETTPIKEKQDRLAGVEFVGTNSDQVTLYEICCELDLPGFEDVGIDNQPTGIALPYVVTLEPSSHTILAIRRNWSENDPRKQARQHFVQYVFIPGLGSYGLGLIHIIGGLTKSATSILRQLVDAGTLSNLPAGYKTKGMRVAGGSSPLQPGEFRDVDVPQGTIAENVFPLPFKEPSAVLLQLMETLVREARQTASVADAQIADSMRNQEAPVGTTLALLERSMKVMTAIQARLHASLREEFRLLSKLIASATEPAYEYEVAGGTREIKASDYDSRVDVLPVSDPNAASMTQRIMVYQSALQLAVQSPAMYDMPELHRQMLTVLGIKEVDLIIPRRDQVLCVDPVTENMAILNGKPTKVFPHQDHQAHITVHMAAMQDPLIQQMVSMSPSAPAIQAAAMSHIMEHLAAQYRKEIEQKLGVPLPPPDQPLPEEIEAQMSSAIAAAAQKLLASHSQQAEQSRIQQELQDPVVQQQQIENQLKQQELQIKAADVQADNALAAKAQQDRVAIAEAQMKSREKLQRERMEHDARKAALLAQQKQNQGPVQ